MVWWIWKRWKSFGMQTPDLNPAEHQWEFMNCVLDSYTLTPPSHNSERVVFIPAAEFQRPGALKRFWRLVVAQHLTQTLRVGVAFNLSPVCAYYKITNHNWRFDLYRWPLNVKWDYKGKKGIYEAAKIVDYSCMCWSELRDWRTRTPVLLAQVQSAAAPSLEKAAVKVAALRPLAGGGGGGQKPNTPPSSLSIRRRTVENMFLNAPYLTAIRELTWWRSHDDNTT